MSVRACYGHLCCTVYKKTTLKNNKKTGVKLYLFGWLAFEEAEPVKS
jgi:hypothetical protein